MPRSTINFDTVWKIGLALSGVEESTAYGQPALKTRNSLACVLANRSYRTWRRSSSAWISMTAPNYWLRFPTFTTTDHYVGYNAVLVRLSRVNLDLLRDLLGMAHKFVTRDAATTSPTRKRRDQNKKIRKTPTRSEYRGTRN